MISMRIDFHIRDAFRGEHSMLGTVDLKIKLEARLTQDGNDWIACCPPLDLFTQADNKESALAGLREAISGWFESCLARGVLAKALEEVGFRLAKNGESIPEHASIVQASQGEEVEVSIPAYIAATLNSSTHASR
jgi:predicted RNase H-like HicB family nuclease